MAADDIERVRTQIGEALRSGDRAGAVQAAIDAVGSGAVSVPALYAALSELLVGVGVDWRTGQLAVWQEHVASAIVRTVIESLYPSVQRLKKPSNGRTVVLACPEDETHELGLRMLADRFELVGWSVCYLGADTPAAEIAEAARATNAQLIALSVSTHFRRVRLATTLENIERAVPDVRIVVGGPAMCHETGETTRYLLDPNEFFEDVTGLTLTCEGD